jgi:hypothetical protein
MAKGGQNRNKVEFSKNEFQDFSEKYEDKSWPVVINYPLQSFQVLADTDYHEEEN